MSRRRVLPTSIRAHFLAPAILCAPGDGIGRTGTATRYSEGMRVSVAFVRFAGDAPRRVRTEYEKTESGGPKIYRLRERARQEGK